jgi:DNA-binding HxlR family transcriptional regulator
LKRLCDLQLLTSANDKEHLQRKNYSLTEASIDIVPMLIDMSCWTFKHSGVCVYDDEQIISMRSSPSEYSSKLVEKLIASHLA